MTIKVGDKVPSVTVKRLGAGGLEDVDTGALFRGRKVVVFSVPGSRAAVRLAWERLIAPEVGHVLRELRKDASSARAR